MARVLITGIVGSLARLLANKLLERGDEIVGVDYRPRPLGLNADIKFYQGNYNKRIIEDVFRRHKPQKVLHLGRVGNLKTGANKRFDLNVMGSAKIMELSLEYDVERLVVFSTFHIYGAHPHNHIPIFENEPLRAAQTFPQLADAVQLDNQASMWVYRHRKLKTVVLRPCTVIGAHINNAFSKYLRRQTQTYMIGFSPMWQFIDETDMMDALQLAADSDAPGVFNVAGAGAVPLVAALELTGANLVPVPAPLAELVLNWSGSMTIPSYFLDFLKYPCVISDAAFRETFGYEPQISVEQSIRSTVNGA